VLTRSARRLGEWIRPVSTADRRVRREGGLGAVCSCSQYQRRDLRRRGSAAPVTKIASTFVSASLLTFQTLSAPRRGEGAVTNRSNGSTYAVVHARRDAID
jgi:hypothetical protein